MEIITIKISLDKLQFLIDNDLLSESDYEVKESEIKDNFFKDDKIHQAFKSESIKAYKKLKEYEYNKRFDVK